MLPIRFKFRKANDYRVVAVNSAWLHNATNGLISIDLVVEKTEMTADTISNLENGVWTPETPLAEPSELIAVREAQVGVILTPAVARVVAALLIGKADELDQIAKNQRPDEAQSNERHE
jgi:hypothetical protein